MKKMLEYAIEGHDGSAKTPIAEGVKQSLTDLGYKVRVYAPYHIANSVIPEEDIFLYWGKESTAKEAVSILEEIISEIRVEAERDDVDVVIYDRHWMTTVGMIEQYKNLANSWDDYLPTFFIEAPVTKTLDCKRFSFDVPWTSSVERIQEEYDKYMCLADKYSQHIEGKYVVKTRTQSLCSIIDSITDKIVSDLSYEKVA